MTGKDSFKSSMRRTAVYLLLLSPVIAGAHQPARAQAANNQKDQPAVNREEISPQIHKASDPSSEVYKAVDFRSEEIAAGEGAKSAEDAR